MTEENTVVEADKEDVSAPAPEAGFSSEDQPQTDSRDFEAEAREMGWVPETEFNGPKERWKPAQQFVEDGEKILPIVRSQLKRTQDEMAKKEADFQKRLERLDKVTKTTMERMKAQHKTELERIKAAKEAAVESGDVQAYKKLELQEMELGDAPDIPEEPAGDSNEEALDSWVSKNAWYKEDFEKADEATRYSQWLAQKNPKISLADNLAQTEAHMRKKHPELFGDKKPAANGHAAVDGGSDFPTSPQRGKKGASQLPSEARAAGEKFVKDGLFKNLEEYAKEYFSND